jgi:hypothetical protein
MPRRSPPRGFETFPPLLSRLVEALGHSGEPNVAAALVELGQLAEVTVPMRGLKALSGDDEDSVDSDFAIQRIAEQHLGLKQARDRLRRALDETGRHRSQTRSRPRAGDEKMSRRTARLNGAVAKK